jgi:hypothetical protein
MDKIIWQKSLNSYEWGIKLQPTCLSQTRVLALCIFPTGVFLVGAQPFYE